MFSWPNILKRYFLIVHIVVHYILLNYGESGHFFFTFLLCISLLSSLQFFCTPNFLILDFFLLFSVARLVGFRPKKTVSLLMAIWALRGIMWPKYSLINYSAALNYILSTNSLTFPSLSLSQSLYYIHIFLSLSSIHNSSAIFGLIFD